MSESEAIMLSRRILIAKMLLEGKTYSEIIEKEHVGLDTIARVQDWLVSGFGGYESAIKKFEAVVKKRFKEDIKRHKESQPYSFEWLKKKYPLHFLLFNLLDKLKEE